MQKMKLPADVTSVSVGGKQYDADANGVVEVEGDDVVLALVEMGATGYTEPAPETKTPETKAPKGKAAADAPAGAPAAQE